MVDSASITKRPATIRPATVRDLFDALRIVEEATHRMDEQGIHQWDDLYPNEAVLREDIRKQSMYLLEVGRRVAGLVVINEEQSPGYERIAWAYPGRVLVVHRLVVDPACQRCGFGSFLMDFVERYALRESYDCIRLDAFTHNPAATGLYENRGYRKAGVANFRMGQFFGYEKHMTGVVHDDAKSDGGDRRGPSAEGG